jgi:hypothetical protein
MLRLDKAKVAICRENINKFQYGFYMTFFMGASCSLISYEMGLGGAFFYFFIISTLGSLVVFSRVVNEMKRVFYWQLIFGLFAAALFYMGGGNVFLLRAKKRFF